VALPVKTPGEGSRIYTTTWDANPLCYTSGVQVTVRVYSGSQRQVVR
jgi:hypothetical protein